MKDTSMPILSVAVSRLLVLSLVVFTAGCQNGATSEQEPPGSANQATSYAGEELGPINAVLRMQEITEILPFNDYGEQGVIWADFDNNHRPDLLYMRHGENPGLYKQIEGRFVDVFADSGIKFDDWEYPQQGDRHGSSCADYDNDGNQDIFIGHGALIGETLGTKFDELLRGNGNFVFEDVSYSSGVLNQNGRARGGQWADINNDGWLDLYISNFQTANVMYKSNKDGTFTDVTEPMNLGSVGWRSSWADFNGDGYLDVVQASPLQLHLNQFGESFVDVTETYLGDTPLFGYSLAWADLDNDGDQDLLVGRLAQDGILFRNDGEVFTRLDFSSIGLIPLSKVTGIAPNDMDNDGDLDIVIKTSDGVMIFQSSGSLRYDLAHVSPAVETDDSSNNGDLSIDDFDGDGLLDIATDNSDGMRLYRNTTYQAGNWLRILFEGTINNRMGYGNKVEITTGGGSKKLTAEYTGASAGMRSNGCQPLHVGIGSATSASIKVIWPNGRVSQLDNVDSDTVVVVTEE